jgi:hypothetical protein
VFLAFFEFKLVFRGSCTCSHSNIVGTFIPTTIFQISGALGFSKNSNYTTRLAFGGHYYQSEVLMTQPIYITRNRIVNTKTLVIWIVEHQFLTLT